MFCKTLLNASKTINFDKTSLVILVACLNQCLTQINANTNEILQRSILMYNILKHSLNIRKVNKETKLALVFNVQSAASIYEIAAYSIM